MPDKDAFYYWFTGLLDGEGSFVIYTKRGDSFASSTILSVTLRADDTEILKRCCEEFGGSVQQRPSRGENWSPTAVWTLRRTTDCRRLLDILDRYQLQSKKQRDYLIWRQAVLLRTQMRHGGPGARAHNLPLFEQIEQLKADLNNVRKFKELNEPSSETTSI